MQQKMVVDKTHKRSENISQERKIKYSIQRVKSRHKSIASSNENLKLPKPTRTFMSPDDINTRHMYQSCMPLRDQIISSSLESNEI